MVSTSWGAGKVDALVMPQQHQPCLALSVQLTGHPHDAEQCKLCQTQFLPQTSDIYERKIKQERGKKEEWVLFLSPVLRA